MNIAKRLLKCIAFLVAVAFSAVLNFDRANAEPVSAAGKIPDVGSRRELFVDSALIEKLSGSAVQRLHRPAAREVVLTTDAPWEGNTCAYYSVFRDGDRFRMYYRGSHWDSGAKRATHREVTCYAESRDGIKWTKPELGLFEFDGSKANNIVLDGIGTHCFAAFKDGNPDCEPGARYKGIARGRPAGKKGLYVFKSPDGIRWSLIKDEPVITEGAFDSQNLAFWDGHIGRYREYHRTFVDGKRAVMTSTSSDFINWAKPELLSYQAGIPAQHLYTNAVQAYSRAPHLLIGFPTRYLPDEGQRVEPTLMLSRDKAGRHFYRWPDAVIPESAPEDRGGNRSNYMAWGMVEIPGRPNHLSVYASEAYYTGADSRLRRFEFRKDGFVSINADASGGELLTKPFIFSGSRLELNAATSASGSVRVEIQSADGKPFPGFAYTDCQPLNGDQIDAVIAWKPGAELRGLAGKPVRLRFRLEDADLYSFSFVE